MALLALSIIYITFSMSRKWIITRCVELGIETKLKLRNGKIIYFILATLWIICIFSPNEWMFAVLACIGIFILFCLIFLMFCQWKENSLVSGAIARSTLPVYALSIILLVLLALPALEMRERYIVRHDPLMIQSFYDCGGFTNVETELVKRMRKDYEEIFRKTGL